MEPRYAHEVDVLRKFNPQVTESDLENNDYIGNDDREQLRARIEGVGGDFETKTGNAYRERRVGSPGNRRTYETPEDVYWKRGRWTVKAYLPHRRIVPFDRSKGDRILIRTGRDSWNDITDDEGSRWTAEYPDGLLKLTSIRHRHASRWRTENAENHVRLCYRWGALGGSRDRGGQTELAADITDSVTTATVEDASRLPRSGIALVENDEYVRFQVTDYDTNKLDLERGVRVTTASSHSSGSTIHYCPIDIREAVAARSAVELLSYEDWVESLIEGTEAFAKNSKIKEWNSEWESTLAKHSEAKMY